MSRCKKTFVAEITEIPRVHNFVKDTLIANGVADQPAIDMVLACDEAATNIVEHAFTSSGANGRSRREFTLALNCCSRKVTATFFDAGKAFDASSVELPDVQKNLTGEKRGGYGIFLMKKLVDKIVYSARRRLNITRLVKVTTN